MKAIGLLSGGLDSTLAVRMIVDQGVDVTAVKFTSPFCQCDSGGCCHAAEQARRMGIPLKTFAKGDDYLEVVRQLKHPMEELFELADGRGPTVLLLGEATPEAVKLATDAATAFAGVEGDEIAVRRVTRRFTETIQAKHTGRDALAPFRV